MTAIHGARHRMLHGLDPGARGVQDVRAVGEIVAHVDVEVTVAVNVRERGSVRKPALAAGDGFAGRVGVRTHRPRGRGRVRAPQEYDGRTAPIIDQQIGEAILVVVAGQATHRGHGGAVHDQRGRIEGEGGVACRRPGDAADHHHVRARIDAREVVRKPVAVEIVERHGRTHGRDPGGESFEAGMDRAHAATRARFDLREREPGEVESTGQRGAFGARELRDPREQSQRTDQGDGRDSAGMAADDGKAVQCAQ